MKEINNDYHDNKNALDRVNIKVRLLKPKIKFLSIKDKVSRMS